jgi:transcription antitermination factor NusG
MSAHWYAFNSQPLKEDLLWQQLISRKIECFYPRIRVHVVNPRARKMRAYFPGYLFIHEDLQITGLSTFQYMPYGRGLVVFGGEPAEVPDALIHSIRQRVIEICADGSELIESYKTGDAVLIHEGVFAGYEAIFDARLTGTERVRVLLKMLNSRYMPVNLSARQIKKQTK